MRILLIHPPFLEQRISSDDVAAVPMGLYSVAATLRTHGHDAQIANWHDPNLDKAQACQAIARFDPQVIGFSIVHANRFGGLDIARMAKEKNPDLVTVFGGVGATFWWECLLKNFPQADYAVVGEGEQAMLALAAALGENRPEACGSIPGVASMQNGEPALCPTTQPIADLDALPCPADHFTYKHVSLSRGCPHNCTFCGSPAFWKRRVRFHSPEYFVNQVRKLHKRGVNFLFVSDDTFTLKKDLVIEVCKRLIQEKISVSWNAISRVDKVDADILYWMRKAGCIQISYGVESGCEKTRDLLNKNMDTADILRAFKLTTSMGILSRAYLIYGCPGEGPDVLAKNLDLLDRIKPLGAIFYILDLFPGTKLHDDFLAASGQTPDIWLSRKEDIMYWETDKALTQEQITETGRRLRGHFHANLPGYAREVSLADDPRLKAEHADFLSRLGMTFAVGDYSGIEDIPDPAGTAEHLFEQALGWKNDARAFLGLGLVKQKKGDFDNSREILERARLLFPNDPQISLCQAVNLMNLKEHTQALEILKPFTALPQAAALAAQCRSRLGKA